MTLKLCEVDTNSLAKLEFVQAAPQTLSGSKMISLFERAKSALYCPLQRTFQTPEPILIRATSRIGFVGSQLHICALSYM